MRPLVESTRRNLPDRLRHMSDVAKGHPIYAVFAPIIEAADEIDRLRVQFRATILHLAPETSHAEIDAALWGDERQ